MSPRPAAVLRGGDQDLRTHLIATAAAVIARRGTAGLSVREIAKEAQVADGVLYNYFDGKDDLIAHGLRAYVRGVLRGGAAAPVAGSRTVEANLVELFEQAVTLLGRIMPAFAGTVAQPAVLHRFRELVSRPGSPHAFSDAGSFSEDENGDAGSLDGDARSNDGDGDAGSEDAGLPHLFGAYLRAEQKLGRIAADADIDAAATLLIGAAHDLVLPQVFFGAPKLGDDAAQMPDGYAERVVRTLLGDLRGVER